MKQQQGTELSEIVKEQQKQIALLLSQFIPGNKFTGVFYSGEFEIQKVDEANNELQVLCIFNNSKDLVKWNLQRTLSGFINHDYYFLP